MMGFVDAGCDGGFAGGCVVVPEGGLVVVTFGGWLAVAVAVPDEEVPEAGAACTEPNSKPGAIMPIVICGGSLDEEEAGGVEAAVVAGGGVPGGTFGDKGPVTRIPSGTPRGPTIQSENQ
jgi:hypothetical protein